MRSRGSGQGKTGKKGCSEMRKIKELLKERGEGGGGLKPNVKETNTEAVGL